MRKNMSETKVNHEYKKVIITRANGTKRVMTINTFPSQTDESFGPDCDINTIYKKWMKTGDDSILKQRQGQYLDLTSIPDYATALNTIQQANDEFMSLPAELRKKFANDPQEFITFLKNPDNDAEAVKLGLKEYQKPEPVPEFRIHPESLSQIQTGLNPKDSNGNKRKRVSPHISSSEEDTE